MTFGIQPHSPETGYGYLHAGDAFSQHVRRLAGFVEKSDLPTAKDYVSSGRYFWNSGMFLFRCSQLISEAAKDKAAFEGRSARSLQRAGAKLVAWNADGRHAPVLRKLQAQLNGVCARLEVAGGQRAACQAVLKPAAKKAA
jgi:mannose-1-phosphate guanylyltransferase